MIKQITKQCLLLMLHQINLKISANFPHIIASSYVLLLLHVLLLKKLLLEEFACSCKKT